MSSNKEPNSMGGAVSLTDSNIEFTDCMFRYNSGFGNTSNYDSTSKGGAIYASSSNITIFNCHFLNNTLFNLGNRIEFECQTDGAACHFSDTNASISDTEFINNTATPKNFSCEIFRLLFSMAAFRIKKTKARKSKQILYLKRTAFHLLMKRFYKTDEIEISISESKLNISFSSFGSATLSR